MEQAVLLEVFVGFGLSAAIGFLVGLERSMEAGEDTGLGLRDYVLFALIGAVSTFVASEFDNSWIIGVGFLGVLGLLLLGYVAEQKKHADDLGMTSEAAAIVTFFLGVLTMQGLYAVSIALAIVLLVVLSQKRAFARFSSEMQTFELEATLRFLVITFIVLPVLPHQSLDNLLTYRVGEVTSIEENAGRLAFVPGEEQVITAGESLNLYGGEMFLGTIAVDSATADQVTGRFVGRFETKIPEGTELYSPVAPMFVMHMLAALKPFKVWLIVVLVSFISFVGYILVKALGSGAGIGLTGLIGGLASSTVTTLSFSRRSKEMPAWNQLFAVAILLASSVMFPRLLIQIGVFNQALMRNMAVPILVTAATGVLLAGLMYLRATKGSPEGGESQEMSFGNPFSLKSAITFGLVFASILMLTRLAITYLGEAWLPVVSIVSGLTDADAIAFSLSDAQRSGLISLDWAAFNVVLGALSNTFVKLFFVFTLGDRGLFKQLLVSFLIMGFAGLATMLFYYDLGSLGLI